MAEAVNTNLTTFKIRELTGDKRTLLLRERALPYRPFVLEGTMRHTNDWYPGSPEGTLQVYGAKEEMTTIQGTWKDKFLFAPDRGDAPAQLDTEGTEKIDGEEVISLGSTALTTARELAKTVDDMRRKGQEIEVTWLNHIRRGVIDRFTQKWLTPHDCEWEIAFDWSSQGDPLTEVPLDTSHSDLGDLPNKVQAKVDALSDDVASAVPQAGDRAADALNALSEVGAKLQEFSDELIDNLSEVSGAITAPNDALKRAVGILDGVKLTAELAAEIAEETADGIALDSGTVNVLNAVAKTFAEILGQRAKLRERAHVAVGLRNLAAQQQVALLDSLDSTIVRVVTAREDQDLREVSQQAYGTPDEWQGLMFYNGFKDSKLVAGQVVFVPATAPERGC